ncbi:hypothetical protein C8R45DRAFT_921627 [Mycena sanguinolenta]|nr:hypothetical protein C8R45DRAFT_921627 [Mycena sanguinolenta]
MSKSMVSVYNAILFTVHFNVKCYILNTIQFTASVQTLGNVWSGRGFVRHYRTLPCKECTQRALRFHAGDSSDGAHGTPDASTHTAPRFAHATMTCARISTRLKLCSRIHRSAERTLHHAPLCRWELKDGGQKSRMRWESAAARRGPHRSFFVQAMRSQLVARARVWSKPCSIKRRQKLCVVESIGNQVGCRWFSSFELFKILLAETILKRARVRFQFARSSGPIYIFARLHGCGSYARLNEDDLPKLAVQFTVVTPLTFSCSLSRPRVSSPARLRGPIFLRCPLLQVVNGSVFEPSRKAMKRDEPNSRPQRPLSRLRVPSLARLRGPIFSVASSYLALQFRALARLRGPIFPRHLVPQVVSPRLSRKAMKRDETIRAQRRVVFHSFVAC